MSEKRARQSVGSNGFFCSLFLATTIKQNKNDCTELLEEAYKLINAVLMVHLKSDTGGALPPSMLSHIGRFTETLHKIHIFVEAQQNGSKVKCFFCQGEMGTLLKECKAGLQRGCDIFQIDTTNIMKNMTEMQQDAESRHKAVLTMIKALSDTTSLDGACSVGQFQLSSKIKLSQQLKALPQSPCYHLSQRYSMAKSQNYQTSFIISVKDHPGCGASCMCDNTHNPEEVKKVLSLTDNMPLAINLLAHLVNSEGCSNVLSRWEEEKTSLISDGYDRRSNLDLSISLSLSSPRLNSVPHSKDLLSLLSMLPDGLSDAELVQAKLPVDNILGCKAALI
ncbi:hypothetical protein B0H13DRAFT_1921574 [Mycena leptocephala]|nr:hypothetical protein B0H13DRAFT_1921574 [Mycena leptocephala]